MAALRGSAKVQPDGAARSEILAGAAPWLKRTSDDPLDNPQFITSVDEDVPNRSIKRPKTTSSKPKNVKSSPGSTKDPHLKSKIKAWHAELIRHLILKGKLWASSQDSRDTIFQLVEWGILPDEAGELENANEVHRRHSSWVSDHGKDVKAVVDRQFRLQPLARGADAKYDQASREEAQRLLSKEEQKRLLFQDGATNLTADNNEEKYLGDLHHAVASLFFGSTFPCPPWDDLDNDLPQLGWGLLGIAFSSIHWHLKNVAEARVEPYGTNLRTLSSKISAMGATLPEEYQEMSIPFLPDESARLWPTLPPVFSWAYSSANTPTAGEIPAFPDTLKLSLSPCNSDLGALRRHEDLEALYIGAFHPLVRAKCGTMENYSRGQLKWSAEDRGEERQKAIEKGEGQWWKKDTVVDIRRSDWKHWVAWTPLPIKSDGYEDTTTPWHAMKDLGVTGVTGGDGSLVGLGSRGNVPGSEIGAFLKERWTEDKWETAW
ncbi:hypothetical protein P7C70_g7908, partial [Phenoliferia sp. Uapishka_3]